MTPLSPEKKKEAAKDIVALACCFLATFTAAAIGAIASVNSAEFYAGLDQPPWAPPSSWFGPVWAFLYFLMSIAAWLVWRERKRKWIVLPLGLFAAQLALNALWTWLFFDWQLGAVALAEIILLWLLILATTIVFWRVRPLAGVLLIPYLLWVAYAAALTASLVQRNPSIL